MASVDLAPPLAPPLTSTSPSQSPGTSASMQMATQPNSVKSLPLPPGTGLPSEPVPGQPAHTVPQDHPSTAEHPNAPPPTSTIDPNVPSSQSAPTALPTNPATHPEEQKEAIKNEHPAVIKREVEKTKAAEREVKGEKPLGTVVKGLEDDRLFAMLRRFDVQVTHVLHPAHALPPIEPDLRRSELPGLPSHSDVLKSNLERVIAAIGPSSVRGAREMQRLMSWSPEERYRTAGYCIAYFTCWALGYAIAGVCCLVIVVMCFPDTRRWLFPPVPPPPFTPVSATDPTNKKGDESLLGNVDSATVHRSKAEQAEEQAFEARSILTAYTTRLLMDGRKKGKNAGNSAVGEKTVEFSSSEDEDELPTPPEKLSSADPNIPDGSIVSSPDPKADQGLKSADVVIAGEHIDHPEDMSEKKKKKVAQEAAKRKRDEMVGKMTKATETGLGDFADVIERFTNALSPPSCYPDRFARYKMAGAFVIPPMLLLTFVPAWMFGRAATFGFGLGMWGQPLFIRAAKKFVELVPNWKDYLVLLDMRNSILSGVPTDAQLTLHLLRVGEALDHPIPRPPPPPLAGTPKEAIKDVSPAAITADDDAEVEEAIEDGTKMDEAMAKAKVKSKSHVMGAIKGITKKMAGFRGDVSVDGAAKKNLKEQIGTKIDKVVFKGNVKDRGEIDSYPAKLDGTSGHIIVENRNDVLAAPQITFVPISGTKEKFVWPLDDIVEIKKSHVSAPRLALGWASGAEVEGLGLTIRFKPVALQVADNLKTSAEAREDGVTMKFTRVGRREQLFVRLISMGAQRWEIL